jgi:hypothetical protein
MRLIRHGDTRVRHLAFELVALFRERTHERLKTLQRVIARERSSDTKTRMIEAIDPLVVPRWIGAGITRPVKAVLDLLEKLSEGTREAPSVRLAAAILLARAQPGFLNTAMRHIFTDALVRPDEYATSWNSPSTVVTRVLESLEYLMLNPRIEILMAALPDMDIAEDSHQAARYLLDYAFFGSKRGTSTTSLPDDHPAERPEIDESRLRNRRRSFGSLYPANPTRLTAADLTLTQREVLTLAISLDTPWMVHSNLLERYGLPPTRSAVRDLSELS